MKITLYGPNATDADALRCAGIAVTAFLREHGDRQPQQPVGYSFGCAPTCDVTVWRTRGGNVTAFVAFRVML